MVLVCNTNLQCRNYLTGQAMLLEDGETRTRTCKMLLSDGEARRRRNKGELVDARPSNAARCY